MAETQKILLVDDTADGREPLARLLRMSGYEVQCADNGAEALSAMERQSPNLVLLDLMMPVMNGVEVLERMRSDERFKATPVILLSASSREHTQTRKLEMLGVADFLEKTMVPFDELLERVARAMKA